MLLTLRRVLAINEATIGELWVDDAYQCFTLEDRVRPDGVIGSSDWKVPGKTAIPAGRYPVIITLSARFKRPLPLLLGVPNFAGVRIHSGNTAADTEGCILVGKRTELNQVLESRAALAELQPQIQAALDSGEAVSIEIMDTFRGAA